MLGKDPFEVVRVAKVLQIIIRLNTLVKGIRVQKYRNFRIAIATA